MSSLALMRLLESAPDSMVIADQDEAFYRQTGYDRHLRTINGGVDLATFQPGPQRQTLEQAIHVLQTELDAFPLLVEQPGDGFVVAHAMNGPMPSDPGEPLPSRSRREVGRRASKTRLRPQPEKDSRAVESAFRASRSAERSCRSDRARA